MRIRQIEANQLYFSLWYDDLIRTTLYVKRKGKHLSTEEFYAQIPPIPEWGKEAFEDLITNDCWVWFSGEKFGHKKVDKINHNFMLKVLSEEYVEHVRYEGYVYFTNRHYYEQKRVLPLEAAKVIFRNQLINGWKNKWNIAFLRDIGEDVSLY